MSKHTPGPWATDQKEHDEPHQNIRVQAGKRGICLVWMDDAPVRDYNAEQRANARLIAAAPDLLEALKAMLTNWEEDSAYGSDAADKARAAIAKAGGEV